MSSASKFQTSLLSYNSSENGLIYTTDVQGSNLVDNLKVLEPFMMTNYLPLCKLPTL